MNDFAPDCRRSNARRAARKQALVTLIGAVLISVFITWLMSYAVTEQEERDRQAEPLRQAVMVCDQVNRNVEVCAELRRQLAGSIKPREAS